MHLHLHVDRHRFPIWPKHWDLVPHDRTGHADIFARGVECLDHLAILIGPYGRFPSAGGLLKSLPGAGASSPFPFSSPINEIA